LSTNNHYPTSHSEFIYRTRLYETGAPKKNGSASNAADFAGRVLKNGVHGNFKLKFMLSLRLDALMSGTRRLVKLRQDAEAS